MANFKTRIVVIILAIFTAQLTTIKGEKSDSGKLEELIDDFFEWRLYEWPVYGTKFGLHQYNDRMDNYTEEVFTKEKTQAEEILDRAKDLDDLEPQEHVSLDVLKDLLEHFITGYEYRKYSIYNSIGPIENLLSNIQKFISLMPTEKPEDYDNLLARYRLIPTQVEEIMALMKVAVQEGLTVHNSSVEVVVSKIDSLLSQAVEDTTIYAPFTTSVIDKAFEDKVQMGRVQSEASTLIEQHIIPMLTEYRNYVVNEYSKHTRTEAGVGSLPGGKEFYQACLNWHLSVEMTPQEIYDLGESEVKRIEKKMEEIMQQNGFSGTLKEYKDMLMTDPSNFFSTGEEILEEYRRIIDLVHDKLPTILLKVPSAQIEVRESDSGVIGRYSEPPLDGSRPGIFWANVKNPDQKPKFNMMALTLHEAEPGHHTQSSDAIESGIPIFRRAIEYMRYNAVPFNWPFQTAYSEGWALYAEALGEDMGVYTAPNSLFGRYASEIHRATRLVVDTGIHAFDWTIEEAENYMKEHTTLGSADIAAEVRRYVAWPGQACSYKIGELQIRKFKEAAQEGLGEYFDLREFHEQVLSVGPVPLSLLENHITKWVSDKKRYISVATTPATDVKLIMGLVATIFVLQQ